MEMSTQYTNYQRQSNDNDDVDILALLILLWRRRSLIFKWCLVGIVVGLVVGYSLPKVYKAKVSFAPETEQKLGSGVSSIASMMGVNLNNSIDAISAEMFPDVLSSTPFLYNLFTLEIETKDGLKTDLLDYMKNHQKAPWWNKVLAAPFKLIQKIKEKGKPRVVKELDMRNLPLKERNVIKYFTKNIKIEQDKKTGKTEVSLYMQDPLVAAQVLDVIVNNLKDYMADYRSSKDRQDVENLQVICAQRKADYYKAQKAYADFADANKSLVLLRAQAEQLKLQQEMQLAYQVYSQVATQLEAARIKEQQAKPVFVILEPVSIPIRKDSPSKAKILIAFVLISGILASCWVIFDEKRSNTHNGNYQ